MYCSGIYYYFIMMILLVSFLIFTSTLCLNVTQFEVYEVKFDAECHHYFYFQGATDYVYLYQNRKNRQFEFWITQNTSYYNYEIYTLPQQEVLTFRWPEVSVNGIKMDLKLYDGTIKYPLSFESETFLCEVSGIAGGTLLVSEPALDVYKCQASENWKLIVAGAFLLIFFASLAAITGVKYGPRAVVLRPIISSGLLWCTKFLSRSYQDLPPTEEERCHPVFESTGSVHFTQENTKTSEV